MKFRTVIVATLVLCLWGTHATASGATPTAIATVAAAATATPSVPSAPSDVHWEFDSRTITWEDNSSDETGFRVIYTIGAGNQPATLHIVAANVTSLVVPEDVNADSRRVAHIVVTAFNANGDSAGAFAEWDDGTPVASPAQPTPPELSLRIDDDSVIRWSPVPGAATYALTGSARAVAVSTLPGCAVAAAHPATRDVTIDETFAAGETQFAVPLPAIEPPDRWLIASASLKMDVLGTDGAVIASAGAGVVGSEQCANAPRAARLPGTGAGAPTRTGDTLALFVLVALIGAGGLGALWASRVARGRSTGSPK